MSSERLHIPALDDEPAITGMIADALGGGVSTLFLETVAVRHPAVRRVLMSGSPHREWHSILDRGVVVATLAKPFDLNQLWAVIHPINEAR